MPVHKILFFIDSLRSGGRERRLIELLYYLKKKTNYNLHVVLTQNKVHYDYVYDLNIPITIIERRILKKDPGFFFRLFFFLRKVRPDFIHSWNSMTSFYAIPACVMLGIPLINNEIADAFPRKTGLCFKKFTWWLNHRFSDRIIANSTAGLKAYEVSPDKGLVIYNGVRLERFQNLPESQQIKKKYNIKTPYAVVMVASFIDSKDYKSFVEIGRQVCTIRNDVTFVAVGDGPNRKKLLKDVQINGPKNFAFTGNINDVEALVNACDIGMLLTKGEGLPNAVMEYMALGKPVIATDAGGTRELLTEDKAGFLIPEDNNVNAIIEKISLLLDNKVLRKSMGGEGYKTIKEGFCIEKMGNAFIDLYKSFFEK